MGMRKLRWALMLAILAACGPEFARGLQDGAEAPKALKVRPELLLSAPGPLTAVIGKRSIHIADEALGAWLIDDDAIVAYSARDGAGGFENEGQALYLFDLRSGRRRKLVSEVYVFDDVQEVKTSSGKRALLISMQDGGRGAEYVAVADPMRGEVFFHPDAEIVGHQGDRIKLGLFRTEDAGKRDAQPYKTVQYDLNALLKGPVIRTRLRQAR